MMMMTLAATARAARFNIRGPGAARLLASAAPTQTQTQTQTQTRPKVPVMYGMHGKKIDFDRIWKMNGILFVNKAPGMTSRKTDEAALRAYFGSMGEVFTGKASDMKFGHLGTLDPFATGVLPVMFGLGTKFGGLLPLETKRYKATIKLGVATYTGDCTGEVTERGPRDWQMPSPEQVQAVCEKMFTGTFMQVPPVVSAININGERAYVKARRGEQIEMKPRKVHVHKMSSEVISNTEITVDLTCATGLYVRSIAVDLANALGTCGHLTQLERTATGAFDLASFDENSALLLDLYDIMAQFPRVDSFGTLKDAVYWISRSLPIDNIVDVERLSLKNDECAAVYAEGVPVCLIQRDGENILTKVNLVSPQESGKKRLNKKRRFHKPKPKPSY